jgi:hypothetical protein
MSSEGFAGPLCKAVWSDEEGCKEEQGWGKRCLLGVDEEEEGKGDGDEAGETVTEGICGRRGDEEKNKDKVEREAFSQRFITALY